MTSIFRVEATAGDPMVTSEVTDPIVMVPNTASERFRNTSVWVPWDSPAGVEIELPATFDITIGAPPSMETSTLLLPLTEAIPIVAEVPVKVKVRPVPGHMSSLVAGLTLPRNRKPDVEPVGGVDPIPGSDVEAAVH